jgi:hypothetical protein
MPPTTGTAALPHDLLARICSLLPLGDAVLTVPRLTWRGQRRRRHA